jgi:hypothetical protein
LVHSDGDSGKGILSQYRYSGPLDQEHVLETSPLTVAPMKQLLRLDERHPSDIAFLPDVNDLDAGYLFVAKEYDKRRVTVYRWEPGQDFVLQGQIFRGFLLFFLETPIRQAAQLSVHRQGRGQLLPGDR